MKELIFSARQRGMKEISDLLLGFFRSQSFTSPEVQDWTFFLKHVSDDELWSCVILKKPIENQEFAPFIEKLVRMWDKPFVL